MCHKYQGGLAIKCTVVPMMRNMKGRSYLYPFEQSAKCCECGPDVWCRCKSYRWLFVHHFKSEHDHKFTVKTSTFQSLNIHILVLSQFYSFTVYTCALSYCLKQCYNFPLSHSCSLSSSRYIWWWQFFLLQIQQISTGWSHLVTFTLSTRSFDYDDDDDDVDNGDEEHDDGDNFDAGGDGEVTGCFGEYFPAQSNS